MLRLLTATRRMAALVIVSLMTAPGAGAAQSAELPPGEDAIVTRVVSGDTIEVKIQGIGFTIGYLGVDAPDAARGRSRSECYSAPARQFNSRLVQGQTVWVERDQSDFDESGRLLRYVYLRDGRMVNEELLKGGYARASDAVPNQRYRDRLAAAEQAAREGGLGLWAACVPKAPPTATPVPVALDSECLRVPDANLRHHLQLFAGLPNGACVLVPFTFREEPLKRTGRFVYRPPGTIIRLDRSLVVFWQDGNVSLTRDENGQQMVHMLEKQTTSEMGKVGWRLIASYRPVERAGDRGQMVSLPGGRVFVLEDAGNGVYRTLIHTLEFVSGDMQPLYHFNIY
jgi:endonuclease YncB( thermonuclease family)